MNAAGGIRVAGLFIYPIKGAGAVEVEQVEVEPRGLAGDRRWMVVDADGLFVTQRTQPRLALVRMESDPAGWRAEAPGLGHVVVPAALESGPQIRVRVWNDEVEAIAGARELDRWFSELLQLACRLVFMPAGADRAVDPHYGVGHQVSFADAFPILLVGQASLDDLNARLEKPVPMNRFRPNLVVDGADPYAEDGWEEVRTRGASLAVVKPCSRCVVTSVDQASGKRGREPLATLATYRRFDDAVMFGQNAIPRRTGQVARGDSVNVTVRGRGDSSAAV